MNASLKRHAAYLGFAFCVAMSTASAADTLSATESLMTMRVEGEIAIDPQGKVLDYRIDTTLQPELQALIGKAVPRWSFMPVVIDGRPVAAKTKMRITLAAQPVATGYAITVDNVTFRDDSIPDAVAGRPEDEVEIFSKTRSPPRYPTSLMHAGIEGIVLLHMKLTPLGKVDQVVAVQSTVFNIPKGESNTMSRARRTLEETSVSAAKRWTFSVDTKGRPVTAEDLTVSVPINYSLWSQNPEAIGRWRHEFRGPFQKTPWLTDTRMTQRIGVSDVEAGEMSGLSTPFKLRDGVVGKAL